MRVGFLGPAGTYSQEAALASLGDAEFVGEPQATVHDTVMAVHDGRVERALVPMENSLEGAVNATLDALAFETDDVLIVGEVIHPVHHCLIAHEPVALETITTVVSHPQATGQCAAFLRSRVPRAAILPAASTADAVRQAAERPEGGWAAIGSRLAAELYGATVLAARIEDGEDNETRFVWIARDAPDAALPGPWKTALVFWGAGTESPGWLVRCLTEFAERDVNLTRIESRPRRRGLGSYMFFVDLVGRADDPPVADAIGSLRDHAVTVRLLGSFPAAR